ncbi:hypothetical protein NA57DRAFT_60500 [Rhizodiscina lignyota]|uniref:Uncharacterized protein n=1 Tax=Rhizodiscina lignyota TaxID=1504668 RepID=A0A9P4I9Z3_9PEZI|nr:hypothetical protein NA57DRAFT_60500 [Rhizodiscina lignyota]
MATQTPATNHNKEASFLEQLPTELLQEIAIEAWRPSERFKGRMPTGPDELAVGDCSRLTALRLCCKTICCKIEPLFVSLFKFPWLSATTQNLSHLQKISLHPRYRLAVEEITDFTTLKEVDEDKYRHYKRKVREELEAGRPDSAIARICRLFLREQPNDVLKDLSYLERSGLSTAMLTLAFRDLPNLQALHILQSVSPLQFRRFTTKYGRPSLSHTVSTYLAAAGLAGKELRRLRVGFGELEEWSIRSGVAVQNLPKPYFSQYSKMEHLEILLSTQDNFHRGMLRKHARFMFSLNLMALLGPDDWIHYTAEFLSAMPGLNTLKLGFDDWIYTKTIFSKVADVHLPSLTILCLHGLEMQTEDFIRFICRQPALEHLELCNCNFTGESWKAVLETLHQFSSLQFLRIYQVAENGLRTSFPETGDVIAESDSDFPDVAEHELDPYPYRITVWPSEAKRVRLAQFIDDYTLTILSAQSDEEDYYVWLVVMNVKRRILYSWAGELIETEGPF